MRVMVDTNVILPAIIKRNSIPDLVLTYVCENHDLILCEYIIKECYDVAERRFSARLYVLDQLFSKLRYEIVTEPKLCEIEIRDKKDQPILNAALGNDVEILITGDKHFLELELNALKVCTPSAFIDIYTK